MVNNRAISFFYKYFLHVFAWAIIHVWNFFESVLFIGGFILCIMLPVVWPMKFVYALLWLIIFYICSKVVSFLESYRDRNKNRE
ncbi:MAG TPA: hypothetical protein DC039_13240 [Leclercia adecarboxylata]|uniref:Uncharacterized protein n=1 Tax=Leclercia adecarboxylata TaxID=83655 RepID=A0A855ELE9_9ENTR|nr:hypothetical protein CRX53_01135 [Leclercia adecarboxylata]QFH63680.1 hypothetical protein FR773_02635 [Leclercia adecarboxylata]HBD81562.1 hypothetical protein [Leclercia adecarboxylata]HBX05726.1 hypothetical protein [Leclercia adecarboxylata]